MTGDAIPNRLMKPSEVAAAFNVDPRTVTRWHKDGKLRCVRTLGNHRRFIRDEVETLLYGPREAVSVLDLPEATPDFGVGLVTE